MNKSIRLINDNYISPEKAAHKLRAARKFHTPLYLYGVTGIGKTSLVMNTLNMRRCCLLYTSHLIPRIAPQLRCSRNPPNIRNPLIYCVNRYFLIFGVSQVQTPYRASTNGFLTFLTLVS